MNGEVTGTADNIATKMSTAVEPAAGEPIPLRVIIVGAGLIGRQRATALHEIPGATLSATVDPVSPPLDGVAHFTSLTEVPADSYDAAVIAVPHHLATSLATEVLRAGRPILMEKPLGTTVAQAAMLTQLALQVPTPSFVGYNYRFLPAVAAVIDAIRSGALGTLRNIDLLVGHGGHPGSAEGWKLDPVRAGGGVLLDPGVHLLDLLLQVAPDVRCASIVATRGFWGTGIEEDVVATFTADDLIATVRVSHIRWLNTFRIEAYGDEGYAIAEGRGGNYGPMTLRRGRRWAWRESGVASQRDSEQITEFGDRDVSLRDELAAVADIWTGRNAPPIRPADLVQARRVTELCEQLYPRIGGAGVAATA
jgi:1,5-anhydro-D-fructose reductase (1,5-anhydro-D-mannitol-forming)